MIVSKVVVHRAATTTAPVTTAPAVTQQHTETSTTTTRPLTHKEKHALKEEREHPGRAAKEAIEAGLQPHQQELMDCYLKKVGRRRWLGGHVKIHWDIKKDGTITKVVLSSESDLGSWPIEKLGAR